MKLTNYFKDTYNELLHKVSWPSWEELQESAIVVMVASFILALLIALMDLAFREIMEFLYGIFYTAG